LSTLILSPRLQNTLQSNFLNKFIVKANEPRTITELLIAFVIPITIVFGSEFAQNPKIIS
ncbi:hypothetical protein, partial [Neobacillus drentensis]|uniref:hypothetical protein n=1 Tax=Neobacillus drentensis TaxID=220684 RepID=UPI002FFF78E5